VNYQHGGHGYHRIEVLRNYSSDFFIFFLSIAVFLTGPIPHPPFQIIGKKDKENHGDRMRLSIQF